MAKVCAVCGKRLKLLDQNVKFTDGYVGEECYQKVGMKNSMSDINWANTHSVTEIAQAIQNNETIDTKALLKAAKDSNNAEKQQKIDNILNQFKEAGVTDTFGTKKEINALPDILGENEIIRYATSGLVDGNTILMICTDLRIVFIDKGLVYGIKSTEIPLDMVNSANYEKGMLLGKISIVNGAVTTIVDNVNKNTASKMVDIIKQARLDLINKEKQPVMTAKTEQTLSDKLKALKSLLDQGILTQDEFDAKKKQLLGI